MGVRLRTTLTATAVVAAALALASFALFAALSASLADATRAAAVQDARQRAAQAGAAGATCPTSLGDAGTLLTSGGPGGPGGAPAGSGGKPGAGTGGNPGGGDPGTSGTGVAGSPGSGGQFGSGDGSGPVGGGPTAAPGGGRVTSGVCVAQPAPPGAMVVTESILTEHGAVTVQGRASTAPARAALATLTHVLLPGVPALLALVALLTWLAVGRALRPVSAIRAKVADITARDLHERVPEPSSRDEVAALARTVNATLDRLQTAVGAHRQFVADAAHELRSPMAVLRTRLELAHPAERRLAAGALEDVGRLQALTADLLLLARLDAREPIRTRELDLAQVVAEEASRRRPRPDVRVTLRLTPDVLVDGSPDHLRRLVANLVDNAVRHAAATVAVTLTREPDNGPGPGAARLDVADDGPGIPPEHRATVFDRFTRLDHARTRDTGGSGLGLPIARDIAAAHHGTLLVVPADSGARLRAVIPLRAEAAPPPGVPRTPPRTPPRTRPPRRSPARDRPDPEADPTHRIPAGTG